MDVPRKDFQFSFYVSWEQSASDELSVRLYTKYILKKIFTSICDTTC